MARKVQSRGSCTFCGKELAKGGLSRHLKSCEGRKEANAQANTGKAQAIYHVQVQDAYDGDFWLHLEINGSAKLQSLDYYLRAVWLECCGHMSHFSIGSVWNGQELSDDVLIDDVFSRTDTIEHIYDYGTSSETKIKAVGVREGRPLTKHPIMLMGRNRMPAVTCQECDKQAAYLCIECVYEDDATGLLCDEHTKEHPHVGYGEPMPFVNSPRVGMCGYDGPAEPPY